jgi:GH25 family lysozyme M1 (1,4-beta-N-acetylmuramidase)/peptidoglycan hydrolase-like protein with peptidoglycan-binding domain
VKTLSWRRALAVVALSITMLAAGIGFLPSVSAGATTNACAMGVRGIDVSNNNGSINWSQVPGSGVAFAWLKVTEGTTYVDHTFMANWMGAGSAGLVWGGYHFAQPSYSDAPTQARFFVSQGGAKGVMPPVLDLEVTGGLNPTALGQWANSWLTSVAMLTGRTPIVYSGGYFPVDWSQVNPAYRLWVAGYPAGYSENPNPCALPLPRAPLPWVAWQYTSSATSYGISGHIDESVADAAWFASVTGIGTIPAPTTTPTAPSVTPTAAPWQVYSLGSRGPYVAKIQQVIGVPADGYYGPATVAAVKVWQAKIGATADGVWGPATDTRTAAVLAWVAALPLSPPPPVAPKLHIPVPAPTLHQSPGAWPQVAVLQFDLDLVGAGIHVDGQYGPGTTQAVANLQRVFHISADGTYGPQTAAALNIAMHN